MVVVLQVDFRAYKLTRGGRVAQWGGGEVGPDALHRRHHVADGWLGELMLIQVPKSDILLIGGGRARLLNVAAESVA